MPKRTPDLRAGREAPMTRAADPLPSHTTTASPASSGSARNLAASGKRGINKQAIRVIRRLNFEFGIRNSEFSPAHPLKVPSFEF
jgi:hypothetical protein